MNKAVLKKGNRDEECDRLLSTEQSCLYFRNAASRLYGMQTSAALQVPLPAPGWAAACAAAAAADAMARPVARRNSLSLHASQAEKLCCVLLHLLQQRRQPGQPSNSPLPLPARGRHGAAPRHATAAAGRPASGAHHALSLHDAHASSLHDIHAIAAHAGMRVRAPRGTEELRLLPR